MYKIAELFAGIGGIGLGFRQAGFETAWANEIDKKACITYKSNFDSLLLEKDIKEIDPASLPPPDILAGGFPCQAFSIAGNRKGFEDERGMLFFDIIRFAEILSPRVIFLENVKNLAAHNRGETFKTMQNKLKETGYTVKYRILNTAEYSDIPQNRERIYILCFKEKKDAEAFQFPSPADPGKRKKVRDFLEAAVPEEFYYAHTKYYSILKKEAADPHAVYQWRRYYVRGNKSGLCPALTANMGTGGHNVPLVHDGRDIRKLTPRECARLQGYPDSFILPDILPKTALYKQTGNSVSVPVIKAVAANLLEALEKKY